MRFTSTAAALALLLGSLTFYSDSFQASSCAAATYAFEERDVVTKTIPIQPGTAVRISGINGFVEVSTADSNTAEIEIVRTAKTQADLEFHKVLIETANGSLVIRGERENERNKRWGRDRDVRQEVTVRLPRSVDLDVSGVNGRVGIGAVDGRVDVSGVNGPVEVAHAGSTANISGVNGAVTMNLERIASEGLTVSGVNGRVTLAFGEDIDGDLDVNGINGSIDVDMPRVTVQGKVTPQRMRATIGAGGAPIRVTGVNGAVRLTKT